MINREPVENRLKRDAKRIAIPFGVGVYMNVYIYMNVWGELTVFRKV